MIPLRSFILSDHQINVSSVSIESKISKLFVIRNNQPDFISIMQHKHVQIKMDLLMLRLYVNIIPSEILILLSFD